MRTLLERFEEKYIPEPNSGCWLWIAGTAHGYGRLRIGPAAEGNIYAHIASYSLFKGHVPPGALVCHKCGVTFCVNPEHLYLGNYYSNHVDSVNHGTYKLPPRKERSQHHNAKLSEAAVEEIRSSKASYKELAETYGVGKSAIHKIKKRISWR